MSPDCAAGAPITVPGDCTAVREHLAAGRAVYSVDDATPRGRLIKRYPDGRRELVKFCEAGDRVVATLPSVLLAGAEAQGQQA